MSASYEWNMAPYSSINPSEWKYAVDYFCNTLRLNTIYLVVNTGLFDSLYSYDYFMWFVITVMWLAIYYSGQLS